MKASAPPQWHEDEEFWVAAYAYLFPETSFERAKADIEKIVDLSGCRRGAALDLCCGPGRHATPLAKLGFATTAVDRSPFYLEKAQAYADREGVEVAWVLADMRDFIREQAFDLVVNLTISFGYFDAPRDNRRVLERIYASLKPGGALALEVAGKEVVAKSYAEAGAQDVGEDWLVIQRRKVVDNWNRLEMEWLDIRDGVCRVAKLRTWMYSGQELKNLLAETGFAGIKLYGDYDGGDYDASAARLVAVAYKPDA